MMRSNEKGFSMVETVISILLIGILATAYLGALSTCLRVLIDTDRQQTARTLAEHQLEYIKGSTYALSYTPDSISEEYDSYSVSVSTSEVVSRDINLQKIKILVSFHDKPVVLADGSTLQSFKVNR
jgi:prepilin-type N-terminal cleavage/methylation domain-containing protein